MCDGFAEAVEALKAGKAVVFPTDTVYGLGVSVEHARTPRAIYDLKQRDAGKPIGELRDAVISPAGTTGRGCMELAKGAFAATAAQAVIKAAERSAELGKLASGK